MASIRALLLDELGYDPDAAAATWPWGNGRPQAERVRTVAEVAAELASAEVAPAMHAGEPVAVVRTATGRLYVLPDRCPHDGGPISDGFVEGEHVVCARHGWEIDACSGSCDRARAAQRLARPALAG